MPYLVGTSGYNYPEWRGSFYPEKLAAAKMLDYYAARFPTVEINYTFYRMPSEKQLATWASTTPAHFVFTLKAPRRITHDSKLQGADDLTAAFISVAKTLGPKLGVLLFQLPPTFKRNLPVLDAFLHCIPSGTRAAFEFRHLSWLDEEVYALLRQRNLALCIADSEKMHTPTMPTADYGYFRLRDEGYKPADLRKWAATIERLQAGWTDTFIYFKHEEQGIGPEFAQVMIELLTH
jgi:uncharacterized protein YecE (DUF72 family)